MALPSQGGFSSVRGGGSYRRRRRRKSASWLIVGVIAIGGATWLLWPSSGEELVSPQAMVEVTNKTETVAMPPAAEIPVDRKTVTVIPVRETPIPKVVFPTVAETAIAPKEELITVEQVDIKPIPLASTVPTAQSIEDGMRLIDKGLLVDARAELSKSLRSGTLSDGEAAQARGVLTDIADTLVFSKNISTGDPFSMEYIIRPNDTLSGIVKKMNLQVDWRFIQRINGIKKANAIRIGQNIKLVTGPFHANVDKSSYRMDVYLGEGEDQVFVRSYRVGLGEFDSTPIGMFTVRQNSKLVNPTWINPRTREFYAADNPDNPIGERWIGLQGIDEHSKDLSGLGIHGTVEPQTIGTQASMGCIRMHQGDVGQVYEMLSEGVSTVQIQ